MAKVSIIIPCKKYTKYLKQCVEKCKELEYEDFEILIVADEEDPRILEELGLSADDVFTVLGT